MIEVRRDHHLELLEIRVPITNNGETGQGEVKQQTKVDGILAPLVRIGEYTIPSSLISYMSLTCHNIPKISIVVDDAMYITKILDSPSNDNRLQLQIIPAVSDTYRKINLMFYISDSVVEGASIMINGTYYIPGIYDSVIKAYGRISTYELFDSISEEYSLGFSSNVSGTQDVRWIYNPNQSIVELMDNQIEFSGADRSNISEQDIHVFDWWIGWWNELNLVDVYKEYNEILSDDQMQVWMESSRSVITAEEDKKTERMLKMFTNAPVMSSTQNYMLDYTPTTVLPESTDLNLEVYIMDEISSTSTIVVDGDIKNNILARYEYGGEVFGEYDYLTRKACRKILYSKIMGNCIEVIMRAPLFGYIKGSKVNVYWYDINNHATGELQKRLNEQIESNIPLPDNIETAEMQGVINKTVSGQYYIVDTELEYDRGEWRHKFILSRSAKQIQKPSDVNK